MDWEQMPYFLAAARLGTLRGAAEQLQATHATVRRHIEVLEASYGVQLFRRTRRGLELTDAGRSLIPIAEQAETLLFGARRRLQGQDREASGVIKFSMTGTMAYDIVAPILAEFSEAHPEIDLEINVTDSMEDINRLETDVSLRYALEVTDDVVARKLCPMHMTTLASRSYIEKYLPSAGDGGEGLHWIGWGQVDPNPDWLASTPFPNARARHSTTDHVLQVNLARQGYGMITSSIFFAKRYDELQQVPGTPIYKDRFLWLLLHSELRRTTRVRRFVDFLAEKIREIRADL